MSVKVECESCKAPYVIDERRIPATGLRVRCPKCAKTFVIKKPTSSVSPDAGATAAGFASGDADLPATTTGDIGLPAPVVRAPVGGRRPAGTIAFAGVPPTANPNAPAHPLGGDSVKLPAAPPVAAKDSSLPPDRDLPARRSANADLPATRGTAPGPGADLPATRGTAPRPNADLPAMRGSAPGPNADLPATRGAPGAGTAPSGGADLPAAKPKPFVKGTQLGLGAFVPKLTGAGGAPATKPADDLPAMRDDLPAQRGAAKSFGEIELPSPVAAKPGAAPPRPKPPSPPPRFGQNELELPSPKPTRGGDAFADLPSVSAKGDLPSPRAGADLPSPRGGALGELDLPSVSGGNLPSPKQQPQTPPGATKPFGEIDLPTVSGNVGLPAAREGRSLADLPSVLPHGAHLPSVAGPGLPAVAGPGLPSYKGAASHGGGAQIPAPPSFDPFGGLMESSPNDAQNIGVAQTMAGPAFQPRSEGNVSDKSVSAGFGELELPGPDAASGGGFGGGFGGEPTGGVDLGLRSGTPLGFGELDLDAPPQQTSARAGAGGSPAFGEVDIPGPSEFGASPNAQTFGGSGRALESNKPPSIGFEAGSSPTQGLGDEAFGEAFGDVPGGDQPPAHTTVGSAEDRAGGMGFGEVDLGGGGGAIEDDMEFGAIPQTGSDGSADIPSEGGGGLDAPLPRPRTATDEAPEKPKKPSRAGLYALVFLGVIGLGGASLEFTKFGAFGRNVITDKLNAEKYAASTQAAIARTRGAFADDSLDRATAALVALDQDVATAPRYQQLLAYAAYANFAVQIRFGKDGALDAKAKRLLAQVTETPNERKLAEGARDVVAGVFPAARAGLKALLAADAKNVDAAVTLGELELRDKKPKDAVVAFQQAKAIEVSARTRSGLMRAYDAAGQIADAKKEATELATTKGSKHVLSRLLLAHYAWDRDKDEKTATKWLDELSQKDVASNAAPAELIDAQTLRGMLLLDRGRITDARAAFDAAIASAKGTPAPMAQLGLGEVDMASGQYPAAIAAFTAASTAQPDLTPAKIGIARAKLKQELPADAKQVLVPLKDPKYAGEIGFWLGQAEEKLEPEKPTEAIKIYEDAIKAQPTVVQAYIALAKLQSKIGKPDEAEATLQQALKAVPPTDKLFVAVGELKYQQGRYEDAVSQFEHALQLQPENLDALFDKGRALVHMGPKKIEEGKAVLDAVEKKDPKYPGLTLEMGFYYLQTKQVDKALERYQAALDAAPNDVDVKLSVGVAMVESQNPEAEQTLRDVLDKCSSASASPDYCSNEARHYLGRALLNKGSVTDALAFLKQAVEKNDSSAQYHLYYGWALEEMQHYEEAAAEIDRALELDKSLSNAYWLRAEILQRKSQFKDAIAQANEALKQNPQLMAAHATIAAALYSLGQEGDAVAEYRKAIDGDPRNKQAPWWRFQVADIYFHQNATPRAAADLKECVAAASLREPPPTWLPKAYFYLGEALRYTDKEEAKKAYRTFLEKTPGSSDPSRPDARAALQELGAPYNGP